MSVGSGARGYDCRAAPTGVTAKAASVGRRVDGPQEQARISVGAGSDHGGGIWQGRGMVMNDRSRLVRGKLVMQLPRVVFGLMGWFAVGVLLPPVPAWILLTVLVAGGVACLLAQRMMARLLWWAWRTGQPYRPDVPCW